MPQDKRRLLIDRIRERARDAGLKFEDDPAFASSIEQWIEGDIDAKEIRDRYKDLLARRRSARQICSL